MFRRIFLVIFSALVGISTLTSVSFADSKSSPMGGDWVPWPFGLEQDFPWADMQGLWKAEGPNYSAYFSLRVVADRGAGVKILRIRQLDGGTCRLVSAGVGVEQDSIVRAQMTGKEGNTFLITFRAFNVEDSPEPLLPGLERKTKDILLLSISTFGGDSLAGNHMQIVKVSSGIMNNDCLNFLEKNKK